MWDGAVWMIGDEEWGVGHASWCGCMAGCARGRTGHVREWEDMRTRVFWTLISECTRGKVILGVVWDRGGIASSSRKAGEKSLDWLHEFDCREGGAIGDETVWKERGMGCMRR